MSERRETLVKDFLAGIGIGATATEITRWTDANLIEAFGLIVLVAFLALAAVELRRRIAGTD